MHSSEFRENCHGDFFIGEYRGIDSDIRNACVKRPADIMDLRESFSRIFRSQQWSVLFPGGSRKKRFLVRIEPHDHTLVFKNFDVLFAQHDAAARNDYGLIFSSHAAKRCCFRLSKSFSAVFGKNFWNRQPKFRGNDAVRVEQTQSLSQKRQASPSGLLLKCGS